ncbi:MAG: type II secretion system F family protein [Lachnospiraceae bacterium]|nr:type II secretion system F family protein [Lachnospiraceae bacterium]
MLIINLIIIIIFLMLALISRKHFSKYKKLSDRLSLCIFMYLKRFFDLNKTKTDLRKIHVVSDSKLDEICRQYYTKIISICMVVIFVINLACLLLYGYRQFNKGEGSNVIKRGGYDDEISITKIYVGEPDNQREYELSVYPREYTADEFYEEADKVFNGLKSDILGNNEDLQHISGDLNLPVTDKDGRFDISWESDYPEYILPSGRVNLEELRHETEVNLVAEIMYLDFTAKFTYNLVLVPCKKPEELSDEISVVLKQIETNSRNDSSFEIPDEINGNKISISKMDNNSYKKLFFLGIVMCTFTIVFSNNSLSKKKRNRECVLEFLYPSFVNRISLLIGSGMNIRNCFISIIADADNNILTRELEFTVNQIKAGYDEATAYEELGIRIGIPVYNRLMSHISQNLRMGTGDLRTIMADEVREAMEVRKENAKKKGERASTKLLFPMIILMAVVIVIIMFPAFVGI